MGALMAKRLTNMERFESFLTVAPNGCVIWGGGLDADGYGIFWADGKSQRAHRWIYQQKVRPLLLHEQVLHNCDNPTCVNFEKCLYAGTHKDNMRDLRDRGQAKGIPKTEEHKAKIRAKCDPEDMARRAAIGNSSLTEDQILKRAEHCRSIAKTRRPMTYEQKANAAAASRSRIYDPEEMARRARIGHAKRKAQ